MRAKRKENPLILNEESLTWETPFVKANQVLRCACVLTLQIPSVIFSFMKFKSLFIGLALVSLAAGCKMPAETANAPPNRSSIPSSTPTTFPTPTKTLLPTRTPTPPPSIRIESADQALFLGDWEKALDEYQAVYEASADQDLQVAAALGSARAWMMGRNYFEAVKVLEAIILNYPESAAKAEAYFQLAESHNALEHYAEAADAYLNYLVLRPGLIDAYVLNFRADALFAAGDYSGAIMDYQASLQSPSLLDNIQLQMKLARANALSGEYETALALYNDIYNQTSSDDTRALIDLRKGQIYTNLGQTEAAWESYLDAVNNYPTSTYAYTALIDLVDQNAPVPELQRGIVDYYAGQYGVALAALERYLADDPDDPGSGLYYYGLASRAAGDFEVSIDYWDRFIENYPDHPLWDDAWQEKAYTQWFFMEQYSQAVQTYLKLPEILPTHERAGEFIYNAALTAERGGDIEQAAELFERVSNLYPNYEYASRSLYLSGISRYRINDFEGAEAAFRRMISNSASIEDRAAALLWIGKVMAAKGDREAAETSWQQAAGVDPTSYYSERANDLLNEETPFSAPGDFDFGVDIERERAIAESWVKSTFGLDANIDMTGLGPLVDDPYFLRGTELQRLGRTSEARAEFENLRQSYAADAGHTYRLINFFLESGLYRPAILATRGLLELALLDDLETFSAPSYFNHVRFGPYFDDLIIPNAYENEFHPLFLFSVVRQESLFDTSIRSSAAASGLMQIIPNTGEEIANNLGWPENFTSSDLNRPIINVAFGADYLDTQRNLFEGDLYAALAAYNGGPGNALQWREIAGNDPDVFLETIRYLETRNYIKVIYEVFNIYRWLYERTP